MRLLRRGIQETVRDLLEDAAREPGRISVEAQARGVSVTELLAAEITAAVGLLLPSLEAPWAGN
jgi:hypothetical protein